MGISTSCKITSLFCHKCSLNKSKLKSLFHGFLLGKGKGHFKSKAMHTHDHGHRMPSSENDLRTQMKLKKLKMAQTKLAALAEQNPTKYKEYLEMVEQQIEQIESLHRDMPPRYMSHGEKSVYSKKPRSSMMKGPRSMSPMRHSMGYESSMQGPTSHGNDMHDTGSSIFGKGKGTHMTDDNSMSSSFFGHGSGYHSKGKGKGKGKGMSMKGSLGHGSNNMVREEMNGIGFGQMGTEDNGVEHSGSFGRDSDMSMMGKGNEKDHGMEGRIGGNSFGIADSAGSESGLENNGMSGKGKGSSGKGKGTMGGKGKAGLINSENDIDGSSGSGWDSSRMRGGYGAFGKGKGSIGGKGKGGFGKGKQGSMGGLMMADSSSRLGSTMGGDRNGNNGSSIPVRNSDTDVCQEVM